MRDRKIEALENINHFNPEKVFGKFQIPVISAVKELPKLDWMVFNLTRNKPASRKMGVHFFTNDYRFQNIWNRPTVYTEKFCNYGAILSPDFSTYNDFPMALQIYNHYRKHWCGAFWQKLGALVIPTISWSNEKSFEWCFDGEPHDGIIAVSTVGVRRDKEAKRLFEVGFEEMIKQLNPCGIICYGEAFDFMKVRDLTIIKAFTSKFSEVS